MSRGKYHKIAKVNDEMKGVEKMEDKDFEQDQNSQEEKVMEEKKHPVKDWCKKHSTGLKMAGIGLLTFTVGALAGAATKKDGSDHSGHDFDDDLETNLIEIDDNDVIDLNEASVTDSTESTT